MILLASTVEIPYLAEILTILGLSVAVIYVFQRINMPAVLGFLATGVIFGPHALGLVEAGEEINMLSEIGVILLLFIIGLEFSIKSLVSMKRIVLLGGALQVLLTVGICVLVGVLAGMPLNEAVFYGFLLSLSSTAIVLKILQERGQMRTSNGRISLGVLIFQDLIVVPMMLLVPILSGDGGNVWLSLGGLSLKVLLVIGAVYFLARYLVPKILHEIAMTRSRELFLIAVIVICFSVAYLTSLAGLSLALGAFMAGLCISESEYSHQATGLIIPFREIFTSFFFVSIGMLLDLQFLIQNLLPILLITLGVFALKFTVLVAATLALKYPLKTGLVVGFTLFQVGEFAFILSGTGMEYGLMTEVSNQYFLSVSILTMAVTPLLIDRGDKFAFGLMQTPINRLFRGRPTPVITEVEIDLAHLKSHLIIIGYGTNGKNAARTAKEAGIDYIIIDSDPEIVMNALSAGERIIYGDAANHHILDTVQVYRARVAVVAIANHDEAKGVVSQIREICKTVHIVARASSVAQADELLDLGASEAVSEKFETSIEVFARVLNQYLVSTEDINKYIDVIREDYHTGLHSKFHVYKQDMVQLNQLKSRLLAIGSSCPFTNQHLCEAKLLEKHLIRVLAVIRSGAVIRDLNGDTLLKQGDDVIIAGRDKDLNRFMAEWNELKADMTAYTEVEIG